MNKIKYNYFISLFLLISISLKNFFNKLYIRFIKQKYIKTIYIFIKYNKILN